MGVMCVWGRGGSQSVIYQFLECTRSGNWALELVLICDSVCACMGVHIVYVHACICIHHI